MFVLGHLGIATGAIYAATHSLRDKKDVSLDFRLVLLGAVFPDTIDKLIGHVIYAGSLNNGRLFFHTLLLTSAITLATIALRRKNATLPWFSLAIWLHLLFDLMWLSPETALWPAYGWWFPSYDLVALEYWWQIFFTDPYVYISEVVGAAILLWLAFKHGLYHPARLKTFILKGHLYIERDAGASKTMAGAGDGT